MITCTHDPPALSLVSEAFTRRLFCLLFASQASFVCSSFSHISLYDSSFIVLKAPCLHFFLIYHALFKSVSSLTPPPLTLTLVFPSTTTCSFLTSPLNLSLLSVIYLLVVSFFRNLNTLPYTSLCVTTGMTTSSYITLTDGSTKLHPSLILFLVSYDSKLLFLEGRSVRRRAITPAV